MNKTPHFASEINIIDCNNFGWENFSFNFYKRFGLYAPVMFPRRSFKNYFINTHWMISKGFETVKYLLPQDVRDTTKFYTDKKY